MQRTPVQKEAMNVKKVCFCIGIFGGLAVSAALGHILTRHAFELADRLLALF